MNNENCNYTWGLLQVNKIDEESLSALKWYIATEVYAWFASCESADGYYAVTHDRNLENAFLYRVSEGRIYDYKYFHTGEFGLTNDVFEIVDTPIITGDWIEYISPMNESHKWNFIAVDKVPHSTWKKFLENNEYIFYASCNSPDGIYISSGLYGESEKKYKMLEEKVKEYKKKLQEISTVRDILGADILEVIPKENSIAYKESETGRDYCYKSTYLYFVCGGMIYNYRRSIFGDFSDLESEVIRPPMTGVCYFGFDIESLDKQCAKKRRDNLFRVKI